MPQVTARRSQEERSAETRTRLIEAAISCLAEHGYEGTSTQRIAAAAGVSRGAQTHQFPTKAALLDAVIAYIAERAVEELEPALKGKVTTEDRLEALLDHLWTRTFQGRIGAAMLELNAAGRSDPALHDSIVAHAGHQHAAFGRAWQQVFGNPSQQTQPLAQLTYTLLHGMALVAVHQPSDAWAKSMLDQWKALVLLGLRQPGALESEQQTRRAP